MPSEINQQNLPVAIACDHGGIDLKAALTQVLQELGCQVLDLGTNSTDSVDYPDFGYAVGRAIRDGQAGRGVLICGTGIGISIAANRFVEVRAALVHDAFDARMARQHNDANVIAFGHRTTGEDTARDCLRIFMETAAEGGRHVGRVAKLSDPK